MKFQKFSRIRRPAPSPKKSLRLHRAEFGSNYKSIKPNLDNYYPDTTELIKKLSKFHNVSSDQIVIGLGAESLIKDIFLWHNQKMSKHRVLNSSSNYFMYSFYAKLFSYKMFHYDINPQRKNTPSVEQIKKIIDKKKINLLVLVNPSSPIERIWRNSEINQILKYCKKKKVILVLDEVYQMFDLKSSINLTKQFDNLIIIRSFSKGFGYPGIRMGYTISCQKLKEEIESFRLAIELPQDTITKSIYLIDNFKKIVKKRILQIINARKFAKNEFKKRLIKSYGSKSNSLCFVFESEKQRNKVSKYLRGKNIFINDGFKNHLSKYASITTTNIKNLKVFFKNFDKIKG